MEKVPGCWEHLSMVQHALNKARMRKSTLATIWLDIANAYGSIPHKLIIFALRRYGVSPQWIRLVENYYKGIFSKSFSESATSAWHRTSTGNICWLHPFYNHFLGWYKHYTRILYKSKLLNLPLIPPNCLCYVLSWMI